MITPDVFRDQARGFTASKTGRFSTHLGGESIGKAAKAVVVGHGAVIHEVAKALVGTAKTEPFCRTGRLACPVSHPKKEGVVLTDKKPLQSTHIW